eukprot:g19814.t1
MVAKRHDQFLLVSLHTDNEGHEFNWDNTSITAQAKQSHAGEFLEVWYSNRNFINKHIELDPVYKPLRNRTGRNTKHPNKPRHINNKRDRTPMLHRRRIDDVTEQGDKTFATKPTGSASKSTTSSTTRATN